MECCWGWKRPLLFRTCFLLQTPCFFFEWVRADGCVTIGMCSLGSTLRAPVRMQNMSGSLVRSSGVSRTVYGVCRGCSTMSGWTGRGSSSLGDPPTAGHARAVQTEEYKARTSTQYRAYKRIICIPKFGTKHDCVSLFLTELTK